VADEWNLAPQRPGFQFARRSAEGGVPKATTPNLEMTKLPKNSVGTKRLKANSVTEASTPIDANFYVAVLP
jgi:hypothetical protein